MSRTATTLLILALLASGCVSTGTPVSPDALVTYRDSMVDLDQASAEALTYEYDWNYRNYREQVQAQDSSDTAPLILDFCEGMTTYEWRWGDCDLQTSELPVFYAIADMRTRLGQLNQLMVDYANFLIALNGANEGSQAVVEAAAEKVSASVSSIAGTFGEDLDRDRLGAFSSIGAAFVRQHLAREQRDSMAEVMGGFQPGIEQFAMLGAIAMRTSAGGIKAEYLLDRKPLTEQIAGETDGGQRFALIKQLFDLNEITIAAIESRKALGAAYQALPGAHRELIEALEAGRQPGLGELVGHIEMINAAYQILNDKGGSET